MSWASGSWQNLAAPEALRVESCCRRTWLQSPQGQELVYSAGFPMVSHTSFLSFFLSVLHGLQDLSPPNQGLILALAVKAPSPNHWTIKKFSYADFLWVEG